MLAQAAGRALPVAAHCLPPAYGLVGDFWRGSWRLCLPAQSMRVSPTSPKSSST